jgi:hypothetical protein
MDLVDVQTALDLFTKQNYFTNECEQRGVAEKLFNNGVQMILIQFGFRVENNNRNKIIRILSKLKNKSITPPIPNIPFLQLQTTFDTFQKRLFLYKINVREALDMVNTLYFSHPPFNEAILRKTMSYYTVMNDILNQFGYCVNEAKRKKIDRILERLKNTTHNPPIDSIPFERLIKTLQKMQSIVNTVKQMKIDRERVQNAKEGEEIPRFFYYTL